MDESITRLIEIAIANGPMGILCLYLGWENWVKSKRIEHLTDQHLNSLADQTGILTELLVLVRALGAK